MKIAPLIGFPGRKLTSTTIKQNLQNDTVQLKTLLAIEEKFHTDIIFYFMDLSVESEALGLKIDFPEDEAPSVIEHPVRDLETFTQFEQLSFNELFNHSRMKVFTKVTENFKRESSTELGAYVIGPFSLAALLMDPISATISVLDNTGLIKRVLEFSTYIIQEYAKKLEGAGADYIVILEPTGVMLSPKHFEQFTGAYITKIAEKLTKPAILHVCGNTTHLFEEFKKLDSVYALSLDSDIDLREAYNKTQKMVIGNINPVTVASASKEKITSEINSLTKKMEGISDFILSTGCDLPPETPIENISLFFD